MFSWVFYLFRSKKLENSGIRIISPKQIPLSTIHSIPKSQVKVLLQVTDKSNKFLFLGAVKLSEEALHVGQNDNSAPFFISREIADNA